jgi:hypothetical protein
MATIAAGGEVSVVTLLGNGSDIPVVGIFQLSLRCAGDEFQGRCGRAKHGAAGGCSGRARSRSLRSRATTCSGNPTGRRRCCARCTAGWSFCRRARTCGRFTRKHRQRYGSDQQAGHSCHRKACEQEGTSHIVYSFASPSPGDRFAQLLELALRVASTMSRPSACACLA